MKKWLAAALIALSVIGCEAKSIHGTLSSALEFVAQLKIGAGGWATRCMTGTNGYTRCRTDTYGAFEKNPGTNTWSQIALQSKMPAASFGYVPSSGTGQVLQNSGGVYSMGLSASGTTVYFMWGNKVFVSSDNGGSYTLSGTLGTHGNDPNCVFRQEGPKMAVDPNNANHVIAGTDQDGLYETFNGAAGGGGTWTSISPGVIPTATAFTGQACSGGTPAWPSYNVAFDPASAHNCRAGSISTCTVYVFAYTESVGTANGKVWKSTDGLATVAGTTSGPTTIADMSVAPTGGILWATDMTTGVSENGGQLWKYNGTWSQVAGVLGHSVAVNPASAAKIAVARNDGAITYSADTGGSWTGYMANAQTSATIPWITAGAFANSTGYMANGNISYDPSLTDTLVQGGGLGPWRASTTGLTGASTVTWAADMTGTEQLVAMQGTAPNGVFVVGNQDKASFYLSSPNSYPADGANPYSDLFALEVTWDIDYAAGNKNFLAQLITPSALTAGDNSGTSNDGGQTWKPYTKTGAFGAANGYVAVDGTAISNCGSGSNQPIFTVPDTTGLTTWANGSGTLLKIISNNLHNRSFSPITKLSSTTFRVDGAINCTNFGTTSATKYNLLVSTNPQSDYDGSLYITNVADNGGGAMRVTFANGVSAVQNESLVCITGVTFTGGTSPNANGCWEAVNVTNATADLFGSTMSGTYNVGTGVATTEIPQGGYLAVASSSNITEWPSNDDHPVCTADGGQTWTTLQMGSGATAQPVPSRVTNAVWAATGVGQITFTTSVATGIQAGETFNSLALSPSGYNFAGSGVNMTAIAGTTGTTVVGVRTGGGTITNPGAYTSGGIIQPDHIGFGFAYYTYRHTGVADRLNANTFYSYNYLRGIYKHVNCAAGTLVSGTNLAGAGAPAAASNLFPNSTFSSLMKSVPGTAHLLFTAGLNSGATPTGDQLYRSTDSGVSWQAISRISSPIKVDCGAIAPGSDYPTCYFVGWYDTNGSGNWVYSIWRTSGTAAQWASSGGTGASLTWTNVLTPTPTSVGYPLGSADVPQALIASGTTWNQWAIGFGGSGWTYGQKN